MKITAFWTAVALSCAVTDLVLIAGAVPSRADQTQVKPSPTPSPTPGPTPSPTPSPTPGPTPVGDGGR